MTEKEFLTEAIPLLEEVETSAEWLTWCKKYSVYAANDGPAKYEESLYDMMQKAYHAGLVITNYVQVKETRKLEDAEIDAAEPLWVAGLDREETLAAIAWHFRRDHFREGSLISDSIAKGALLRLFYHLRDLDRQASEHS